MTLTFREYEHHLAVGTMLATRGLVHVQPLRSPGLRAKDGVADRLGVSIRTRVLREAATPSASSGPPHRPEGSLLAWVHDHAPCRALYRIGCLVPRDALPGHRPRAGRTTRHGPTGSRTFRRRLYVAWTSTSRRAALEGERRRLGPRGAGPPRAILSARQLHTGNDSETLYRHALAVTESNWIARTTSGSMPRAARGRTGARALRGRGTDPSGSRTRLHNLGKSLQAERDFLRAVQAYLAFLERQPGHADALLQLAAIARADEQEKAAAFFEQALQANPEDARASGRASRSSCSSRAGSTGPPTARRAR